MTIERICNICHKPIKFTKVRVKTVCLCPANTVDPKNIPVSTAD